MERIIVSQYRFVVNVIINTIFILFLFYSRNLDSALRIRKQRLCYKYYNINFIIQDNSGGVNSN